MRGPNAGEPSVFRYCAGPDCSRTTPKTPVAKLSSRADTPPTAAVPRAPGANVPNWRIFQTKFGGSAALSSQHRQAIRAWYQNSLRHGFATRYEVTASGPERIAQIQALRREVRALGIPDWTTTVVPHRSLPPDVNAEVRIVEWQPLDAVVLSGGDPAADAPPAPARAGETSTPAHSQSFSSGESP